MRPSVISRSMSPTRGQALRTGRRRPEAERISARAHCGIDLGDADHDHGAGVFAVAVKAGAQGRIGGQARGAVDPHRGVGAGDQEHQADAPVAQDVAQAVDAVVAVPVGQGEGCGVQNRAPRAFIAARGAIGAFGADGGQDAEARPRSGAVGGVRCGGDLDGRRLARAWP